MLDEIHDEEIIRFFYLDLTAEEIFHKLHSIKFKSFDDKSLVPFTAKIRGYTGAVDMEGRSWLLKEIHADEVLQTRIQETAYYIDFSLNTLAAPSFLCKRSNKFYRATKNIQNAMQIGSYNYLEKPFLKILANDLINRWLYFDEDRNPNNYMVLHNSKSYPFIVAIDYNKADLLTETMKIRGNSKKFGWHRKENTRFLTLLKPENFAGLSIDDFNERLMNLMSLELTSIHALIVKVLDSNDDESLKTADRIIENIDRRRIYIENYFKKWFKAEKIEKPNDFYNNMGKSFINMYKKNN